MLGMLAGAALVSWLLIPIVGWTNASLVWLPAIVATTWRHGATGGIIATALSTLIVACLPILHTDASESPSESPLQELNLPLFASVGLATAIFARPGGAIGKLVGSRSRRSSTSVTTRPATRIRDWNPLYTTDHGEIDRNARIDLVFSVTTDPIAYVDDSGALVTANAEFLVLTTPGERSAPPIGRPWRSWFRGDDLAAIDQAIRQARQWGRAIAAVRLARSDGSEREIDLVVVADHDPNDRFGAGLFLILKDHTELRDTQSKLERREHLLRTVGDHLPETALFQVESSPQGQFRLTHLTHGVETILGLNPDQCLNDYQRLLEKIHPEDRAGFLQALRSLALTLNDVRCELRVYDSQSALHWVWVHITARRSADGTTLWDGFLFDLTSRKIAERELRAANQRLESFLDHAPYLAWITDEHERLLYLNHPYRQILGLRDDSPAGRTLAEVFGEEKAKACRAANRRLLETNQPFESINTITTADGEERVYLSHKFPLPPEASGNGPRLVAGTSLDITQRQRLEQELQRARAEAIEASRVKSQFLANLSHEIRTPIASVIGLIDLLSTSELSEAERKETTSLLRLAAEHLSSMVNDVLDLSKIEAGRMTLEWSPTDPCQVIRAALNLLTIQARARGIELVMEPLDQSEPSPPSICTDPTRLRQILVNLIGNAIKFSERGDRVTVRYGLRVEEDSRWLVIDVVDEGIGIAPDQIERLFTPYTQADETSQRRHGGTGLGLAISRRLAEQLGGELHVRSQVGVGSTFTLTLPCPKEASAFDPSISPSENSDFDSAWNPDDSMVPSLSRPPASLGNGNGSFPIRPAADIAHSTNRITASTTQHSNPSPSDPPSARVLIVEDNPSIRRILIHYLKRARPPLEITAVEDGIKAIEAAQQTLYDLILMDLHMPHLDGVSAMRNLRSQGYSGAIVALTADSLTAQRETCIGLGFDDYLTKPISPDRLNQAIRQRLAACRTSSARNATGQAEPAATDISGNRIPRDPF